MGVAGLAMLLLASVAAPANARWRDRNLRTLACGAAVTQDTVLANDIGPCTGRGLWIPYTADNITLDLNGHTIRGMGGVNIPSTNNAPGILLAGPDNVTVKNGNVEFFSAGIVVAISNSFDPDAPTRRIPKNNKIRHMHLVYNVGPGRHSTDTGRTLGDGLLLAGSEGGTFEENTIEHNGPFSGIGLLSSGVFEEPNPPPPPGQGAYPGVTDFNTIRNNKVMHNKALQKVFDSQGNPLPDFQETDGIRIERFTRWNRIGPDNDVSFNGLDGIAAFKDSQENEIFGNTVNENGWAVPANSGQRKGNGILIFGPNSGNATETLIGGHSPLVPGGDIGLDFATARNAARDGNIVKDNAASGIRVGTSRNTMLANIAGRNARAPFPNGRNPDGTDVGGVPAGDFVDVVAAGMATPQCPIQVNWWAGNKVEPLPGIVVPPCIINRP